MNFKQRLSRYFVGIFIGVLLSMFLFSQRNCTGWLPDNRVKAIILENELFESELTKCLMECNEIDASFVRSVIRDGEVNFSASDTHSSPKKYIIVEEADQPLTITVEMSDSSSVITKLDREGMRQCDC